MNWLKKLQTKELAVLSSVAFAVLLWRYGWVCEDAYFQLRTIRQFIAGHGLTWNIGERVQVYTSPLHLLYTLGWILVTGEYYWTTLFCNFILVVLMMLGIWKLANRKPLYYAASLALLASTLAIRDFSLSGFENPLACCLLTWFVLGYKERYAVAKMGLLGALLILTRFDYAVIVAPLALFYLWRTRPQWSPKYWISGCLSVTPLIAWFIFSFIYYGFILPNTYYSKVNVILPLTERMKQGIVYFMNHLNGDPSSLLIIGAAIAYLGYARRLPALLLGLLFYIAYLFTIGGDYMLGRFLSILVLLGVLSLLLIRPRALVILAPIALGFCLLQMVYPLNTDDYYRKNGMSDERRCYTPQFAAPLQDRNTVVGAPSSPDQQPKDDYCGMAGYKCFMHPNTFYIDLLTDPCLVRIPSRVSEYWRPGHMYRPIPPGYFDAVLTGNTSTLDKNLLPYCQALWTITREPVFSAHRWHVMLAYYRGDYNQFLQAYTKRDTIPAQALTSFKTSLGEPWNKYITFNQNGLDITFQADEKRDFYLWLSYNASYTYEWLHQGRVVGRVTGSQQTTASPQNGGFTRRFIACPGSPAYDTVRLTPLYLDGYGVGQLQFEITN